MLYAGQDKTPPIDPDSMFANRMRSSSTDLEEELGGPVDGAKLFTIHRALAVPFTSPSLVVLYYLAFNFMPPTLNRTTPQCTD